MVFTDGPVTGDLTDVVLSLYTTKERYTKIEVLTVVQPPM